jgi:galactokinase
LAGPAQFLIDAFEQRFQTTPDLFRAPGRVNLIGEHTDYNLGFVLPIAIDLACYTACAPNREGIFRVYSLNFSEGREWAVDRLAALELTHHWTDYVIGVARQIPQTRGIDLMIHSTVPVGSGLSSSASLEVSTALAAGWRLEEDNKLDLARLCQRAENEFVGLPSGIMDQYASVFGHRNHAVKIDCRSLEHEYVPLPSSAAIVAVNSMVKHELGQSAYRDRVAECRRAVEAMRQADPGIASLRDASLEDLPLVDDPVARKRARHIITENLRVEEFVEASRRGDLQEMGRLFVASHRSLQVEYEVSCAELDFLVETALAVEGVYGARMTGGGFGGCTVNLMDPGVVDNFESTIVEAYRNRFDKDPAFYRVEAADGATKLS